MKKSAYRFSALALAAAMMIGQTAYADTVVTAESPGAVTTAGTAGTAGTSGTVYTNSNTGSGVAAGTISSTGPTGSKVLDANGYLVIGADSSNYSGRTSTIGPGGSYVATDSAASSSSGTAATAAGPTAAGMTSGTSTVAAAAAVNIDSSIAKPTVSAQGAALYDASTGQLLFEENGSEALYPASTTKLLTALICAERLDLSDSLVFNATATDNLESGAVTAGMKAGDTMTVKDAMYALLLRSACEVANGLAEKVAGSQAAFAELMNQRAAELGCRGSHFSNASGLNGSDHYTTANDMALITAAAIANPTVRGILETKSYMLPATANRGSLTIQTGNKMVSGGSEAYAGYIGGKTGYTSKAGNCLAGAVEYNGHTLVAVVLKAAGSHYKDSKALFDYGKKLIGGTGSAGTAGTAAGSTATAQNPGSTGMGTTAASSAGSSSTGTASGKWVDNGNNTWKYQKADGTYCVNEWLTVNGNTYFFGADALMCTGWRQFTNGDWYYFNPENGAMVSGKWVTQNGKSYYLQANGVMAVNTTIDGKYRVNEKGVYVEKVG